MLNVAREVKRDGLKKRLIGIYLPQISCPQKFAKSRTMSFTNQRQPDPRESLIHELIQILSLSLSHDYIHRRSFFLFPSSRPSLPLYTRDFTSFLIFCISPPPRFYTEIINLDNEPVSTSMGNRNDGENAHPFVILILRANLSIIRPRICVYVEDIATLQMQTVSWQADFFFLHCP